MYASDASKMDYEKLKIDLDQFNIHVSEDGGTWFALLVPTF